MYVCMYVCNYVCKFSDRISAEVAGLAKALPGTGTCVGRERGLRRRTSNMDGEDSKTADNLLGLLFRPTT